MKKALAYLVFVQRLKIKNLTPQNIMLFAFKWMFISSFFAQSAIVSSVEAATNRGAYLMPYTRYEAEQGVSNGGKLIQALNFDQSSTASEASGQKYIALSSKGSYVEWKVTTPGKGVDVRFTMPDSADGKGLSGSLDIYVNGALDQTVKLSSYYAWQYFPAQDPTNTPSTTGKVGMRFDEVSFLLKTAVTSGDVIRIQKNNSDNIEYGIDFIELEPVPAPKAKPAGYVSITDYGAIPDDNKSDLDAMYKALDAAQKAGTGVYLPVGKFIFDDKLILLSNSNNIAIKGAGIWYTELYFSNPAVFKGGILSRVSNIEISDFYMNTINNRRFANPGEYMIYKAFMGTYGNNSKIHDIWAEHFEVGAWIGGYDTPYPVDVTKNLLISNVRFRNNYADGVNFSQGTSNSIVEHSNIRNSGDDGLAMWPSNSPSVPEEVQNTFRFNTVEHIFRAGGVAIFGGRDHSVYNMLIKNCMGSSGMRFTTDFPGYTFDSAGLMKFHDIDIQNCGTSNDLWDQTRGAIEFFVPNGVQNMEFDNITITNSQRHAIQLVGNNFSNITFNNVTIDGTGLDGHSRNQEMDTYGGLGIMAQANAGGVTFNNTIISNYKDQPYLNRNQSFKLSVNNGNGDTNSSSVSSGMPVSTSSSSSSSSDTSSSSSGNVDSPPADTSSSSGGSSTSSSGTITTTPIPTNIPPAPVSTTTPVTTPSPQPQQSPHSSILPRATTSVKKSNAIIYYQLKNRWNNGYLFDGGDELKYGATPGDSAAYQWSFESRGDGYLDIKNKQTGQYINIEHLKDYVESNDRPIGGDSSKWYIEEIGNGFVRFRNGWHMNEYMHIENLKGYVQHGTIYPVWESAQWQILEIPVAVKAYYQIKNRWNNNYIFDGGDQLQYSPMPSAANPLYQWSFESRGGGYLDIKNRQTGQYINIERVRDYVESNDRPIKGDSSKWHIEKTGDRYVRFRNGWHTNDYMHIQDLKGYVQHGIIYPVWESAQWQLVRMSSNQVFALSSMGTGKCVAVGSSPQGNILQQSLCVTKDSSQLWVLSPTAVKRQYQFVFTQTQQCMDAATLPIKLSTCNASSKKQLWFVETVSDNDAANAQKKYRFRLAGTQKCLAVPTAGSVDSLTGFTFVGCDNGNNQQFMAIPLK